MREARERIVSLVAKSARKLSVHAREARERIASVRSLRAKRLLVHAREARERLLVFARCARRDY
jgi:hypothetical protein